MIIQFKENPDAWLMVDRILPEANYEQTKCQPSTLETRWNVKLMRIRQIWVCKCSTMSSRHGGKCCHEIRLKVILGRICHEQDRSSSVIGIRNFVVNYLIEASSSPEGLQKHRTLLNKLNLVLVSILKQEWPHNWPTFINEIVSSCHTNVSVCENNMVILRLLSEEVFDYSADQMTSAKTKNLKSSMCAEFASVFQLCAEVLTSAQQPSLLKATLETLLRFMSWIPLGYVFETNIIELLRTRFLQSNEFRNHALRCLTEIGSLQIGADPNYNNKMMEMFMGVMTTIAELIPINTNLKATYARSSPRDQEFVLNLALFLCNFFSMRLTVRPSMIPMSEKVETDGK